MRLRRVPCPSEEFSVFEVLEGCGCGCEDDASVAGVVCSGSVPGRSSGHCHPGFASKPEEDILCLICYLFQRSLVDIRLQGKHRCKDGVSIDQEVEKKSSAESCFSAK